MYNVLQRNIYLIVVKLYVVGELLVIYIHLFDVSLFHFKNIPIVLTKFPMFQFSSKRLNLIAITYVGIKKYIKRLICRTKTNTRSSFLR